MIKSIIIVVVIIIMLLLLLVVVVVVLFSLSRHFIDVLSFFWPVGQELSSSENEKKYESIRGFKINLRKMLNNRRSMPR